MSRELYVITGAVMVILVAVAVGLYTARSRGVPIGPRQVGLIALLLALGFVAAMAGAFLPPAGGALGAVSIAVVLVWFAGRMYWARAGGPPAMPRDVAGLTLLGLGLVVVVMVVLAILTR